MKEALQMKSSRILLAAALVVVAALPACQDIDRIDRNALEYSDTLGASEYGYPTMARVDDDELKARVDAALSADGGIQAGAITVSARKGEVTLSGVVPPEQIFRADAIAREIPGVSLVINALRPVLPVS
jgi:hyperosmotically inducible protein